MPIAIRDNVQIYCYSDKHSYRAIAYRFIAWQKIYTQKEVLFIYNLSQYRAHYVQNFVTIMSANGLAVFDRTLEKTHQFINDVAKQIAVEDKHLVFIGIKAVLHSLRDRIPLEEAAQLGAQFPVLLAGFYYQGWKPAATPTKERSVSAFVDKVKGNLPQGDYPVEIEALIKGVFAVLSQWVTVGEIVDVANMLPKDVQEFWPEAVVTQLNQ